ncbi:TonB-dependent receptor [Pedobacter sp. BS3]|uniref:SusC/RagA family TonB-linked outer membrane protein n=1 Tax=Pedobacter sp. BS3 TaxID=2567937 RepID=UPI0011EE8634|nr:TonB-dependent receptor [Pedobacter sp. BS3]TZF81869.1 TonB-dependent receptor [Pedobacter sp. BS3]
MNPKKLFLTCMLLFWGITMLYAQQRTVRGTVTDASSGEKVADVTVAVVGTNIIIKTNEAGQFVINVPNANGTLRFTHTSYLPQTIALKGKSVLDVVLTKSAQALDEVVVIGYGTVQKKDLTGSVGKVNIDQMTKAPVASLDQALAGRVAGVNVTSTDGQPGDGLNIVIRGNNSVTYSNNPLYVIDGFPMEDFNTSTLNMNDIESIDVLKDASATAIYGARGANGVVIITTKRGKAGNAKISYQGSMGQSVDGGHKYELLSPYEFVKLQLEIDSARSAPLYFRGDRQSLEDYRNVKGIDWYDKIVRPAGFQSHSINVTGGNANTKYLASGSYTGQDGLIINSDYSRYQARLKLDQNISKRARFGMNFNYANENRKGIRPRNQEGKAQGSGTSQVLNLLYQAWTYRPITGVGNIDLIDSDIDPEIGDFVFNPLLSAQNQSDINKINTLTLNGYIEYDIMKSLKLRVTGGANLLNNKDEIFNNSRTRGGSPATAIGQSNGPNGSISQSNVVNLSNENSLTYDKQFNRNNRLTATGVVSIQTRKQDAFGYKANKVPNEELGVSGLDDGIVYDKSSSSTRWGLVSFTGRVNYNWYKKYLFTVTMRADGSSKFPPNSKWGYFPSGAFAWRLGDEEFMKHLTFISDAKLRASYGLTGNNRVSDFGYQQQYVLGTYYSFDNSPVNAYYSNNFANENLKWETTKQLDAGLELAFLKNRLNLEVDYYKKQTYDLLLNATVATSTGYSSALVNIGRTQNSGWEFTLSSTNIRSKTFSWTTDFNISFNRNKLLGLVGGEDTRYTTVPSLSTAFGNPAWISRVGAPITQFYGFVYDGVYQASDFEPDSKTPTTGGTLGTPAWKPGDAKYKDITGNGVVDDDDRVILGSPYPKHVGGLNNSFTYKGLQLDVFFQWSYGNDILNANKAFLESYNAIALGRNLLASYANHWTPDNTQTDIPKPNAQGVTGIWSSRYIEDGSFLRLKTISLAYNINVKRIKPIKSAQVFARAQNLYTWTKYSGPDPEVSTKGFGLTSGFDFSAYPISSTYVLGLNLNF